MNTLIDNDTDIFKNTLIDIYIGNFMNGLMDNDIDINIFKNGLMDNDIDININIFKNGLNDIYGYLQNVSIYR